MPIVDNHDLVMMWVDLAMSGWFMRETTSIIPYLEHPYSIAVVCKYRLALTDVNRNGKLIRRRWVAV
jgi:hypothetical protein